MRRRALAFALPLIGLLAVASPAFAGDVSTTPRADAVLYVGDATAETLTVTQPSATTVTFDLAGAPVTTSDPACVASNSNGADVDNEVTCTLAALETISISMFAGNDIVVASTSIMTAINGGDGDDRLDISATTFGGNANFNGLEGNFVVGAAGNDTLVGGVATSSLHGDDPFDPSVIGNDAINGGSGDETLVGGAGLDSLNAGAGDDTLDGGATWVFGASYSVTSDGADGLNGGDGSDTVTYAGRTVPVTVDLRTPTGQGQANENDTIGSIENAAGGDAGDTLTGNGFSNTLQGNDGADMIAGGGSFDELRGGRDADSIQVAGDVTADLVDCGRGYSVLQNAGVKTTGTDADVTKLDYLDYLTTTHDCETVSRNAAPARAPQLGTGADDRIVGDGNRDLLIGLDGDDVLIGLADSDELQGGFGDDLLYGGTGPDDLLGGNGDDGINGGSGNDTVTGGPGKDFLLGGSGVDTISGGEGVDRMDGGAGRDYLLARDDVSDTVVCTRTNTARDQDVVFADPEDRIVNASFCARIEVS
jgi:Ca2+-binding RTX toxin-like protein